MFILFYSMILQQQKYPATTAPNAYDYWQDQYFRYTQQGQMQMPSPVISESCMVQSQIQEQHLNQQKLHQYQIMMLQQQTTKNHKMVRICSP